MEPPNCFLPFLICSMLEDYGLLVPLAHTKKEVPFFNWAFSGKFWFLPKWVFYFEMMTFTGDSAMCLEIRCVQ